MSLQPINTSYLDAFHFKAQRASIRTYSRLGASVVNDRSAHNWSLNMAPKDPLLATLKVCVLNLQSDGEKVTDSNPHLASCCELLELVLRKGLQQPVLSLVHRDYWQCFEQLTHQDACGRLSALSLAVEQTKGCRKLLSAQGRGRYLLRLALSRKALPQFITHLLHTPRVLEWYSPAMSILRNEEFVEPFVSLLLVLSHMEFKLDMENCSFLDESWLLPAGVVLSRLKGCPLSIGVLRWKAQDGTVYRPLIKLLRALRMENPTLQLGPAPSQQSATKDQGASPSQCLKEGRQVGYQILKDDSAVCTLDTDPPLLNRIVYIVQFLGKANIGMFGDKEVLQHAIPQVLQKNLPSKEVLLDMKETHLTCTDRNSQLELFEHHYPEISCVGRFGQLDYTIFAFCVADSPESPQLTGFCCVVLRASTVKDCEEIVCRIATGFKHTEWSV
ncbi:uncharacterized protein si:ch211-250n8.1 isoform X4 [Siniperca chuatsi]|uniref:uncharacterized protein si:ch211-250n8.1 isoform X4 n=1 Tax=Siniperca chuatsi TaxID=119488 RepID=UPI001CE0938C|nr:uncharacterized protein si:ch211-250n8.1 isoform X4 [Siniperca chuatsi]